MDLLLSAKSWFGQNWMLLVLIVLAIALMVPTYLRQKKESAARMELNEKIVKGTKIVTTAGVYGVVESVEETTDGKVVTISTGSSKNASTMTIHINAIMGIDNKEPVVVEKVVSEKPKKVKIIEEIIEDDEEDVNNEKVEKVEDVEEKVQPKKSSKKSK